MGITVGDVEEDRTVDENWEKEDDERDDEHEAPEKRMEEEIVPQLKGEENKNKEDFNNGTSGEDSCDDYEGQRDQDANNQVRDRRKSGDIESAEVRELELRDG